MLSDLLFLSNSFIFWHQLHGLGVTFLSPEKEWFFLPQRLDYDPCVAVQWNSFTSSSVNVSAALLEQMRSCVLEQPEIIGWSTSFGIVRSKKKRNCEVCNLEALTSGEFSKCWELCWVPWCPSHSHISLERSLLPHFIEEQTRAGRVRVKMKVIQWWSCRDEVHLYVCLTRGCVLSF